MEQAVLASGKVISIVTGWRVWILFAVLIVVVVGIWEVGKAITKVVAG